MASCAPPLLPIISAVGVTAAGKSAVAIAVAQSLSSPLSFFEYQQEQRTEQVAVSSVDAEPGQIVAVSVRTCSPVTENSEALLLQPTSDAPTSSNQRCLIALVSNDPNVFLVNDCLVAARPVRQGDGLHISRASLSADLWKRGGIVNQTKALQRLLAPAVRAELDSGLLPCSQPGLEVKRFDSTGHALTATAPFQRGALLFHLPSAPLNNSGDSRFFFPMPSVYTICAKPGLHMLITDGAECLAHHCDPNTHVQVDAVSGDIKVVAMKDIAPGDIVSFNYLSTEWLMDCAFDCTCGAAGCYGHIAGFSKLTDAKKKLLLETNTVAPIVLALNAAEGEAVVPFKVHPQHPIQRGNIISPRVWRSSPSSTFVRDGTSSFDFWTPSAADSSVLPNACLVPLNSAADCNEWSLVALTMISCGATVVVRPLDAATSSALFPSFSSSGFSPERVSAHIINVDVMQTMAGLPIGTNKVRTPSDRGHLPHYCIGPPTTTVGQMRDEIQQQHQQQQHQGIHSFVDSVVKLVAEIRQRDTFLFGRSSLIILCGGTMYYQLALLVQGVSMREDQEDKINNNKNNNNNNNNDDDDDDDEGDVARGGSCKIKSGAAAVSSDSASLWDRLHQLAPDVAQKFHPNDTRRIQRQIEIALNNSKSSSSNDAAAAAAGAPTRPTLRNFSGRPDEPQPVVLWVHQGKDRAAFVEEQLRRRVDKMRRAGLLEEVFSHALVCQLARRQCPAAANQQQQQQYSYSSLDERRSSVPLKSALEGAVRLGLEHSTRGIESAIGFKEVVGPVLRFALRTCPGPEQISSLAFGRCPTGHDVPTVTVHRGVKSPLGANESTKEEEEEQGAAAVLETRCDYSDASQSGPNSLSKLLFEEQGLAKEPGAVDKELQEGLDRIVTATWRYAAQQDQWLRRKFVPLRREGVLPHFVAVTPRAAAAAAAAGGGPDSKKQQLSSDAFHAVVDACRIAMSQQQQPQSVSRFDVLSVLPELNENNNAAAAGEDSAGDGKQRKQLFRCQTCDKAMVGQDQWDAHCRTKAHQKSLSRVPPTPEQIEKWKAEGDAKRDERRRQRGD